MHKPPFRSTAGCASHEISKSEYLIRCGVCGTKLGCLVFSWSILYLCLQTDGCQTRVAIAAWQYGGTRALTGRDPALLYCR